MQEGYKNINIAPRNQIKREDGKLEPNIPKMAISNIINDLEKQTNLIRGPINIKMLNEGNLNPKQVETVKNVITIISNTIKKNQKIPSSMVNNWTYNSPAYKDTIMQKVVDIYKVKDPLELEILERAFEQALSEK